jgi:hypothetical protein
VSADIFSTDNKTLVPSNDLEIHAAKRYMKKRESRIDRVSWLSPQS